MGNLGAINPRRLLHRRRKLYGLLSFILGEMKRRILVEAGLPAKRAQRICPGLWKAATVKDRFVPERGAFPHAGTLLSMAGSVLNPTLGREVPFFLTQTTTEIDTWCAWGQKFLNEIHFPLAAPPGAARLEAFFPP